MKNKTEPQEQGKHTPGPWIAKQVSTGDALLIIRDGLKNDSPDFALTTAMNRRGPDYIGKINLPARETYDERLETTEAANARLIASAPTMLTEIRAQLEFMDKHVAPVVVDHWAYTRRRNDLVAAIRKAEEGR